MSMDQEQARHEGTPGDRRCGPRGFSGVGAGGLGPNTWGRLEHLSAAWEQAKRDDASKEPPAAELDPGAWRTQRDGHEHHWLRKK